MSKTYIYRDTVTKVRRYCELQEKIVDNLAASFRHQPNSVQAVYPDGCTEGKTAIIVSKTQIAELELIASLEK